MQFAVGSGIAQLQVGDLVKMSAQQAQPSALIEPHYSVEGLITEVDSGARAVTVELPWQPVNLEDDLWQIQMLGNLVTYQRCMRGLAAVAQQVTPMQAHSLSTASSGVDTGSSCSQAAFMAASPAGARDDSDADLAAPNSMLQPSGNTLLRLIVSSWNLWQNGNSNSPQLSSSSSLDASETMCSVSGGELAAFKEQLLAALKAAGEAPADASAVQHGASDALKGFLSADALNEAQAAAVKAAITQRLTLIWGPPGTGKVWIGTCAGIVEF